MAGKTKEQDFSRGLDAVMDLKDHELQAAMRDFLEEEEKEHTNIWNFATIAGITMFFVGMVYLMQYLGLTIGPDLSDLMEVMPLIGGIMVILAGFGFLTGDRKKRKKERKRKQKNRHYNFDFDTGEEDMNLNNDLDDRFRQKSDTSSKKYSFDSFAFRQSRKLYKSRTDKKWAGVCGGLAKYFGISTTVVRLFFVITFFAGSGTSLLVYIALSIALDKEPPELIDDFDF